MKLSTSPSLSSSSTTSVSYQSDARDTKRATIRYLAGVLRRMFCALSFPTHPSDQIMEEGKNSGVSDDGTHSRAKNHVGDEASCPGIVARLMGMESLPKTNSTAAVRCRSVSSVVDHWPDDQMPDCVGLEDVEFFVLNFECGIGSKELWSTQRKSEIISEKDHIRKLRPRPGSEIVASEETCSVDVNTAAKSRRRVKGNLGKIPRLKKDIEAEECSSEDASPVSVLDFGEWNVDDEEEAATPSASDDSRLDDLYTRSKRKLSPELNNKVGLISEASGAAAAEAKKHSVTVSRRSSWKRYTHHEVYKIAETEIMESKWASSETQQRQLRVYEDIGVEMGVQVLDELLAELVVDQLLLEE
ncbi:hypothetical protein SAY86_018207 [Trapa natans]|uniref:DUF3741 domain-containing protein n=1 Tax=Trapa natans TaxID=22666 RepID=A0AAN7LGG3_TRANT|nr:hypothetical protein SAY86_018207 [Trapa natans]